jgi:hypothetical protein
MTRKVPGQLRSPRHLQVREHSSAGFRERRDQSHEQFYGLQAGGRGAVPSDWPGQGLLSKRVGDGKTGSGFKRS